MRSKRSARLRTKAPAGDPPVDLDRERRALFKVAGLGVFVCFVGLLGSYLLLPRYFDFPEVLTDRFVFWARLQVFLLIWVAVGVGAVSRGRRRSAQDIRGSAYGPPSPRLAIRIAFLQNSLEQAVLASGAYLALITVLAGSPHPARRNETATVLARVHPGTAGCVWRNNSPPAGPSGWRPGVPACRPN